MAEPIESLTGNTPPAAERPGGRRTCEFCESMLTANGEVLTMSEKARGLRILSDRHAEEVAAHTATKAQLAAAHARVTELEHAAAAVPASRKSLVDEIFG